QAPGYPDDAADDRWRSRHRYSAPAGARAGAAAAGAPVRTGPRAPPDTLRTHRCWRAARWTTRAPADHSPAPRNPSPGPTPPRAGTNPCDRNSHAGSAAWHAAALATRPARRCRSHARETAPGGA